MPKPTDGKETKPKKRHFRIFCPVCGLLSVKRRFEMEHPFPNTLETFYKGRANISHEYIDEDSEVAMELGERIQDQLVDVALRCLDDEHIDILTTTLEAKQEESQRSEAEVKLQKVLDG